MRQLCPHATVIVSEVTAVDTAERSVDVRLAISGRTETLSGDALILASGSEAADFGIAGVSDHAVAFKTIADALRIRRSVLSLLESAAHSGSPSEASVIVVAGLFEISGESTYEVTDPTTSGLVSFSTDPEALALTGQGSAVNSGFAYAPNGGIDISGDSAYNGAVVAGGDVVISGNGGVVYPQDLNFNLVIGPPEPPSVVVGSQSEL